MIDPTLAILIADHVGDAVAALVDELESGPHAGLDPLDVGAVFQVVTSQAFAAARGDELGAIDPTPGRPADLAFEELAGGAPTDGGALDDHDLVSHLTCKAAVLPSAMGPVPAIVFQATSVAGGGDLPRPWLFAGSPNDLRNVSSLVTQATRAAARAAGR